MERSEIFNTREIAYIVIGLLFLTFALNKKGMRKDIIPVFVALFDKHFIVIYLLTVIYTALCVGIVYLIGMWETSLLKDTIVWMIFAALPTMYKAGRASDIKAYFKETLFQLVKTTVFLEFIMGLYTFSIWIELPLAAFILFLQGLIFYSQKEEHARVHKIFKQVNTGVAFLMFLTVLSYIIYHFFEYFTFAYLEQFLLSFELTLMLIPFLYSLIVYMRFEETFITISSRIKPPSLLRATKWLLIINFFNNITGLKRWQQQFFARRPKTRMDVLQSIKEIKQAQQAEINPPVISVEQGWSPYLSKDYMKATSLGAGQYIHHYDQLWGAISPTLHLSGDYLANDIVYEVTGTQTVVTQLELILKVFDRIKKANSHEVFVEYVAVLFDKVFPGESIPAALVDTIIKGKDFQMGFRDYKLVCHLDKYGNTIDTYNLKVAIRHLNHTDL
jgi:hypothetical protein